MIGSFSDVSVEAGMRTCVRGWNVRLTREDEAEEAKGNDSDAVGEDVLWHACASELVCMMVWVRKRESVCESGRK